MLSVELQPLRQGNPWHGIDQVDSARNVGADPHLGRSRRASIAALRVRWAGRGMKRAQVLREAGVNNRNLTVTGSNAAVFFSVSAVQGFHSPPKCPCRLGSGRHLLSRARNATVVMSAHSLSSLIVDRRSDVSGWSSWRWPKAQERLAEAWRFRRRHSKRGLREGWESSSGRGRVLLMPQPRSS